MAAARRGLVVLDGAGVITAVTGAAPPGWRGHPFGELNPHRGALISLVPKLLRTARMGQGVAHGFVELDMDDERILLELVVVLAVTMSRRRADARSLIDRAVAPFRSQVEELQIALSVDRGAVEVFVNVDESRVVWVIATLIGSAVRFTRPGTTQPAGGTIGIRLTTAYRAEESFAVIEVEDDGPGIDEWRLKRLFRPTDFTPASGLALCMARDVALAHGGDLEVESSTREPHFTRVRLMLPLA
jgi:signal transduction histidine kinase